MKVAIEVDWQRRRFDINRDTSVSFHQRRGCVTKVCLIEDVHFKYKLIRHYLSAAHANAYAGGVHVRQRR